MLSHKRPREKGKISFTRFFQKFKNGDSVAVVKELSVPFPYSNRLQGRTGIVMEKKGDHYYVEIKDIKMPKRYNIHPVHLKKIEAGK